MSLNLLSPIVQAALALIAILCLFFLGRELMMWYWKVNKIVQLLESIDKKLGARVV